MLELDCPHTVADPFIQATKDFRRVRQPEVAPPAQQILPKLLRYLNHTPSTGPAGYLPNAIFHPHKGLTGDSNASDHSWSRPEGKPKEGTISRSINRTLGLVDLEPKFTEQNRQ